MRNVVIIPRYNFVQFCIPKVANSSIKTAILAALGQRDVDDDILHGHPALNISSPARVYRQHMHAFKCAIVRNPFDRLVSCYEQKIKDPVKVAAQGFSKYGFDSKMTFKDFLAKVRDLPFSNIHFQPQLPALKFNGTLLPDYIGKFEELGAAWSNIRHCTTLPLEALPHKNKTLERGPYRDYFDDNDRHIAETVFKGDLDVFGYSY